MKYLYIGKMKDNGKTKYIYYDEINNRFYAVLEKMPNEDDFEYIYELMPDDFEEDEMKPFRIKDNDMVKVLTVAYKVIKLFDIQEKNRKKQIKLKEKAKVIKAKKKRKRLAYYSAFFLLLASAGTIKLIDNHLEKKHAIAIEQSLTEDKQFENYDEFGESITINKTITDDLKEVLFSDFNSLSFSSVPILERNRNSITKRLEKYDFTGLDRSNYISALEYILFGKSSIINKCFTLSLDGYANGSLDNKVTSMFGSLMLPLETNMTDIIFRDDGDFKNTLAEFYNVPKDKIDYILYILESYTKSTDDVEKNNLYTLYQNEVASLLSSYYQNKEELSEFDRIVLASQIFGGDYFIDNNIFDEYIKVTHSSKEYTSYTKYYEKSTKEDVSMLVYQEKLEELIKNKGTYLDYNDPDCRFLLYLYSLCYKDTLPYYNKELLSVKSPEELANLIISRVFDEEGFVKVREEFIYNYLTSGKINPNDLANTYISLSEDALSASLYVDVINCLKYEEYIDSGCYLGYVEKELRKLQRNNEELYDEVSRSLENRESLFDKLSILPAYQSYKSENVKKYIREQKTEEE